jgi:hypothetical protein
MACPGLLTSWGRVPAGRLRSPPTSARALRLRPTEAPGGAAMKLAG